MFNMTGRRRVHCYCRHNDCTHSVNDVSPSSCLFPCMLQKKHLDTHNELFFSLFVCHVWQTTGAHIKNHIIASADLIIYVIFGPHNSRSRSIVHTFKFFKSKNRVCI